MSKKVYIETYGCQMNLADTEIVLGTLNKIDYSPTNDPNEADLILVNTCSVRENAEQRVFGRLSLLKRYKKNNPNVLIGVLGCMAERLKKDLIEKEKAVDLIVGPDEYRNLPQYIEEAHNGGKGIGVRLSRVETYEDIIPYREEGISAWISIMRGCDKFCSFCIVPFTRGRERSRKLESIINEINSLSERGFKEVTLLGQNVNCYKDGEYDFADLLSACAKVDPEMRIRFTTSHPQDISLKLLETISSHHNICKYLHLPVQSGSNRILELMNRNYTIEHYLNIIEQAKKLIPNLALTTDIIVGFPTETFEDHIMTIEVMQKVRYDGAYMFIYSPREGTKSYKMKDDAPYEIKNKRLNEIIDLQNKISLEINSTLVGKEEIVLIEGDSKKSDKYFSGKTDSNKVVVMPKIEDVKIGEYVKVKINRATSATLFGDIVEKKLSLSQTLAKTA